eukprot:TRINITY_DN57203_c0_g1_i2.p1 TRINITY_DN57203_c0_g1~~TRINITY_DN57203_c0_g1_i2.p1  ORF type:complete len:258 (+),score=44.27 TRINITY_DN57203_c0_g1_i2:218-991(+)
MAKLILWCLLLMAVAHLGQSTAAAQGDEGPTMEELSTLVENEDPNNVVEDIAENVDENGETVHEKSVTDKSCHVKIDIATSNSSNSTVIDNLDEDTEVARLSDSPKVCFVLRRANITGNCKNGVSVNQNSTATTVMTNFEMGRILNASEVSTSLQNLCRNLTIQEVIPVETNNSAENDVSTTTATTTTTADAGASGSVRRKRGVCCRLVRRCYLRRLVTYRTVCSGILWFRSCRRVAYIRYYWYCVNGCYYYYSIFC